MSGEKVYLYLYIKIKEISKIATIIDVLMVHKMIVIEGNC